MRLNIPTDLLRSFVTIVDTGSIVRASEHIFLTQSALSLQMKRLTELLQQQLFRRHQGALQLTPAGELLLARAREILALNDKVVGEIGIRSLEPVRIGMIQDFSDAIMRRVLSRFKRLNPEIRMEVKVANSTDLQDLMSSDLLDLALYLGREASSDTVMVAPMAWIGDPDLLTEEVLPVAMMNRPCLFRDASIAALEKAEKSYSIALETPSISVLRAAVDSGLALTCRTSAFVGGCHKPLDIGDQPLPTVAYNLAMQSGRLSPAITSLGDLIRVALLEL